jgi:hypothetical protein
MTAPKFWEISFESKERLPEAYIKFPTVAVWSAQVSSTTDGTHLGAENTVTSVRSL